MNTRKEKIRLEEIKKIILVTSGKGGVGKSTIASNIALALARQKYLVGLADLDIYGPSIPKIFSIEEEKSRIINNKFVPINKFNIKLMSMGFVIPNKIGLVWRGPLLIKALHRLLSFTQWDRLDYLIVDMPPGTGDVHLTTLQRYHIDAVVIVTTPHALSISEIVRHVNMLEKLSTNILGIIENMTYFLDQIGSRQYIFGNSIVSKYCQVNKIKYLDSLPIIKEIATDYLVSKEVKVFDNVIHDIIQNLSL